MSDHMKMYAEHAVLRLPGPVLEGPDGRCMKLHRCVLQIEVGATAEHQISFTLFSPSMVCNLSVLTGLTYLRDSGWFSQARAALESLDCYFPTGGVSPADLAKIEVLLRQLNGAL